MKQLEWGQPCGYLVQRKSIYEEGDKKAQTFNSLQKPLKSILAQI
jgi:hypothetical protein